jgi:hypothetical protein
MKHRALLTALGLLPALLLALTLAAPGVKAAPLQLPEPSPRPALDPAALGPCPQRVFNNLKDLVVFRCLDGSLSFYRIEEGNGRFQAWQSYKAWSSAVPGAVALNSTDDAKYQLLFGRASQADVDALGLAARTPSQAGYWYHVILKAPAGTTVVDNYFFLSL